MNVNPHPGQQFNHPDHGTCTVARVTAQHIEYRTASGGYWRMTRERWEKMKEERNEIGVCV
jgi:hypothetical protein